MIQYRNGKPLTPIRSQTFSEKELQNTLGTHLDLLKLQGDPEMHLLGTEVYLPSRNRLDLFLMDESGLPIIVETKLFRNPEAKRKVVAQVFDYLSEMSLMSFEDIDDQVDGRLFSKIDSLQNPVTLRKQFAVALKNGETRVIIAIDDAPENLTRILRFLTARNLDVRLLEVEKFPQGSNEFSYVSYHSLVDEDRTPREASNRVAKSIGAMPPVLEDFCRAMKNEFPRMGVRPDGRYGYLRMPADCQARFDYSSEKQHIRVSFKLWNTTDEMVDKVISKFSEVFQGPVYKNFVLKREKGRVTPWFGESLEITGYPGGLESQELRTDVIEMLKAIQAKFLPVAEEIQKLKKTA